MEGLTLRCRGPFVSASGLQWRLPPLDRKYNLQDFDSIKPSESFLFNRVRIRQRAGCAADVVEKLPANVVVREEG